MNQLLRLLATALFVSVLSTSVALADGVTEWTTTDIMDMAKKDLNISVAAQETLMRMMGSGDLFQHVDASAMLSALKAKKLAGILRADLGKAAQRISKSGNIPWEAVPTGLDAICYFPPPNQPPLLIYRNHPQKLENPANRGPLIAALQAAWTGCGIRPAAPLPYRPNAWKPIPPPPPPPPGASASLRVVVLGPEGQWMSDSYVWAAGVDGEGEASGVTDDLGVVVLDVQTGMNQVGANSPNPTEMQGATATIVIQPGDNKIVLKLGRNGPPPPPPDVPPVVECKPEIFEEVFNKCALKTMFKAGMCTGKVYKSYFGCNKHVVNPPMLAACLAKVVVKFGKCISSADGMKEALICHKEANKASKCQFKAKPPRNVRKFADLGEEAWLQPGKDWRDYIVLAETGSGSTNGTSKYQSQGGAKPKFQKASPKESQSARARPKFQRPATIPMVRYYNPKTRDVAEALHSGQHKKLKKQRYRKIGTLGHAFASHNDGLNFLSNLTGKTMAKGSVVRLGLYTHTSGATKKAEYFSSIDPGYRKRYPHVGKDVWLIQAKIGHRTPELKGKISAVYRYYLRKTGDNQLAVSKGDHTSAQKGGYCLVCPKAKKGHTKVCGAGKIRRAIKQRKCAQGFVSRRP